MTNDQLSPQSSALSTAVAAALAGLGATEDDRPLIEDAARAMAELGMTDEKPHA
jgi:hypothetical protein